MKTVHLAEIRTPKNFMLNGIWFGPKKARTVIILVHGLGGNMLNPVAHSLASKLVTARTAVLSFDNRGHGIISKIYKDAPRTKRGYSRIIGGAAHEKFEDCADDIQGAVEFARKAGSKEIYLMGHSTGCQKSIYWAAKKGRGVKGIILLAPTSDYAAIKKDPDATSLKRALSEAKRLIRAARPHMLLPEKVWPTSIDAQRFVSAYSGKSSEETFPYWQKKRKPKTLRSVRLPVLVVLAEQDELADRPAHEIASWFIEHLYNGEVIVVPKVAHSFKGGEKIVAKAVTRFMKE